MTPCDLPCVHEGNMVLPLGMAVACGKGESYEAGVKNLDW